MKSSSELTELVNTFFTDIKRYNTTNFKMLEKADLSKQDAAVHKAFSSVITRYFIFREKHPEVTESGLKMLYFKLKLDLVAQYFAEYPDTSTDNLVAFQLELKRFVRENRANNEDKEDTDESDSSIPDIGLESDNKVQVEQQQGSVPVAI